MSTGYPLLDELTTLRQRCARYVEERNEALNCNARQSQRIAQLEAERKRLREALKECADDLEALIVAEYEWPDVHPALRAKYERDIGPVQRALAALKGAA